jgi:hypothetical protein
MALESRDAPLGRALVAPPEKSQPAVSWGAILAGAFAAAVMTLVLVILGSGLGLASASPWSDEGSSAATIGVAAIIWLVVTQWLSAGLGGYMAGRLRSKWTGIHSDESFFRDTAHGFLAWAVATVVATALLASAATSAVGTGVQAVASVGSGAMQGAASAAPDLASGYDIDSLFRRAQPDANSDASGAQEEAGRIIAHGISTGDVPEADRTYLAQLIAPRAGISEADARGRVDTAINRARDAANKAKEAADAARKAGATLSILTALSMMIGAFVAAAAAGWGGRQRDE